MQQLTRRGEERPEMGSEESAHALLLLDSWDDDDDDSGRDRKEGERGEDFRG